LQNLISICDLHHRAVHHGKLVIRGTAPDRLTFEFCRPRDRRNVTDDDAPGPVPRASSSDAWRHSGGAGRRPGARPTWARQAGPGS
jgi:hypothetical protein